LSVVITDRLRESAADLGEEGERWLAELPAHVAALAEEWSLSLGEPFRSSDGWTAWVAPARPVDGAEAVLKIGLPFPRDAL
jgi:hypothetical protein